jgi:hypothetical protein
LYKSLKLIVMKRIASKCNFLCQKCAKTHLRAFVTSKIFPGTPNIKGKGGRGRAVEGKRREGRKQMGGEGRGKGGEGREGRGGRGKGEVNPPTSKS